MCDDASEESDIVVIVGTTRTGLSREGPACIHADTWLACGVGSVMMGSAVMTVPASSLNAILYRLALVQLYSNLNPES